jgi:hypothetical protein
MKHISTFFRRETILFEKKNRFWEKEMKGKNYAEFSCTNKHWEDAKKCVYKQLERGGRSL